LHKSFCDRLYCKYPQTSSRFLASQNPPECDRRRSAHLSFEFFDTSSFMTSPVFASFETVKVKSAFTLRDGVKVAVVQHNVQPIEVLLDQYRILGKEHQGYELNIDLDRRVELRMRSNFIDDS